jgi:hypothetical protein
MTVIEQLLRELEQQRFYGTEAEDERLWGNIRIGARSGTT